MSCRATGHHKITRIMKRIFTSPGADPTLLGHPSNRVWCLVLSLTLFFASGESQDKRKGDKKGGRQDSKDADSWSAAEYSGLRGEKELRTALASKGFSWLSGSPADNEKLSVGKNAQYFGFVALRYQSGRAANRGMLGRAMFAIADEEQRQRMVAAVHAEKASLQEWWNVREEILTKLEDHLYTGQAIDRESVIALGKEFSRLSSSVAFHEASAFAAFEDSMTTEQRDLMTSWRADAESAGEYGKSIRVEAEGMNRDDSKQLEDLYAKAFSWITGKPEDNEIIPIGQPAQFFGFVSIRHKSGQAASRGKISKSFTALLNDSQQQLINEAVSIQMPVVREFLENRHEFLKELSLLRTDMASYNPSRVEQLSDEMGRLEIEAACMEAEAYRNIRASMSDKQVEAMMEMRGEYVLDESQVATMDTAERGAALAVLCSGCHGEPGQHRIGFPAPNLDGFWDRKIATAPDYEFSMALTDLRSNGNGSWTPALLDQYLTNPKRFAPGTKMEFQGLLKEEDRKALIEHLKSTR